MAFRRLFGRTSSRSGIGETRKEGNMAVHKAENTRSLADVYDSIKNAVVTIELPDGSSGSGFAVRADGVLATNQHVIDGHPTARVRFVDGNDTTAQVVQSFRDVDLAFLLTKEPLRQVLPLDDGEKLRVGQDVFALGNPLSLGHTLTKGTISALDRLVKGERWIQTDTAINPGNSGGPLCNLYGSVVGMVTRGSEAGEGLNFALPASMIKAKLALLPEKSELLGTLHCPVCGSVNEKGKYCGHCGADISSYVEETAKNFEKYTTLETCSVCQTKAQQGQRHCGHCGASLELALLDTCPVCQTRAQQGQQHCGHCGGSLIPGTDED